MRGKPFPADGSSTVRRITPAGAGKTAFWRTREFKVEDHPRRCGENATIILNEVCNLGSPPQVRGKLPRAASAFRQNWITPAGAGKTADAAATAKRHRDHPRRCGENAGALPVGQRREGSPPQVRGKLILGIGDGGSRGITPAGAGKTALWISRSSRRKDHPRRCGENLCIPRGL